MSLSHSQYKRKIALQAAQFRVKKPAMRRGFFTAQQREMDAYKRISVKWEAVRCNCDEKKAEHEEKHGEGRYPYFKCVCNTAALHPKLVKAVARVNKRHLALGMVQNAGVLAHIKRGEQAWQAKKKWKEMKQCQNTQTT